jgi:hypothetical protein
VEKTPEKHLFKSNSRFNLTTAENNLSFILAKMFYFVEKAAFLVNLFNVISGKKMF